MSSEKRSYVWMTEHPGASLIEEEMKERGWNVARLALEMGGDTDEEIGINYLAVEMLLACRSEPRIRIGEVCAAQLGRAFGCSAQFFLNLDATWRARGEEPTE